jgi:hypothetical protein
MKDTKGGFMVDEGEGKKEESEAILKRRDLLEQLKKPVFDPGISPNPPQEKRGAQSGG